MEIKPFYLEDIAILAKRVSEIWRFDDSPEFTRIFCEYLVRCNYYSPQLSFKIVDEEGLQAIAFGCMPEEKNDAELAEAVMKLPFKLKEVILLYYYQGMNVNEIADALNISHSSVSGRLKRGKEKLKNMLEGRELDE